MSHHSPITNWHSPIANVGEEAVVEELFPHKELYTTVTLQQDLVVASFHVHCSWESCYR